MDRDILALQENWDGEAVVTHRDLPTGTWIFIVLHSTRLGRPTGGSRMKVYPSPVEALRDGMRLAEGMTHKWATLGMPYGGGKSVLAIPGPLATAARDALLKRYGALLTALNGAFATGADLGTTAADMATIGTASRWVMGIDSTGASIDPGPFTAHGVLCSIETAIAAIHAGNRDFSGRVILVQGLGGVGLPLARALAERGAELLLSDIDPHRTEALAAEIQATVVPADEVYTTPCDVYAPCAVGATLHPDSIAQLRCKVVAGSANNQLLASDNAELLHARGILYVPDYVANGGGAMALALVKDGLEDRQALFERVAGIGTTVAEILREAAALDASPLTAARQRVARRLAF